MDVDGLQQLISARFDALDERIDGLTAQVRETNGRVRAHELAIPATNNRVSSLERTVKYLRSKVTTKDTTATGENRRLLMWDATVFAAGIGALYALLKVTGRL